MPRTLVGDLAGHVGEEVTEPASEIEAVLQQGAPVESAVTVVGTVVDNPAVKLGGLELIPTSVQVVNRAEPSLPIRQDSGIDHRLDWRFLDLRHPARHLIFDVQSAFERGLREFAFAEGATEMHTPKLMGTASESGAEVFAVKYFDTWAYLAQSPQFYKQMAISGGFDKFFEIGPVFRAEPSFTSRHATEFTGIDVEIAWIDSVENVMCFEERMLTHALTLVRDEHGEAIQTHCGVEVVVPDLPFPRLTRR